MPRGRNLRHATSGGTVRFRFVIGRNGIATRSEIEIPPGGAATDRPASAIGPGGLEAPPVPPDLPARKHIALPPRFGLGPDI